MDLIRKKSLTELENNDWGESNYDSYLAKTCHALRYKPISEFEVEDLRIMIGQDIGLTYLLPVAIQFLEKDLFCEGMHYPGDLLCNVIKSNSEFLANNLEIRERIRLLVNKARIEKGKLDEIDFETFDEAFKEALSQANWL